MLSSKRSSLDAARHLTERCPIENKMIRSTTFVLLYALSACADTVSNPIPSEPVFLLKDHPLLFADNSGIAFSDGVSRTIHPAKTDRMPVLEPDRPWEGDRVYVYGSVYHDNLTQQFRLWYSSIGAVLYATSNDGLHWDKPSLDSLLNKPSQTNNVVHFLHSPSVLLDTRDPDRSKRYKMIGARIFRDKEANKIDTGRTGYYTATSEDGLHWKDYGNTPALSHWDTVTLTQDPRTGDYLAYHKRHTDFRGFNRRVVWLARSRDFLTWSEPELVFGPDEEDDAWAKLPKQRTEIYNMSVLPHAAGFIGLPTMFRVTAVNRPGMGPNQSPDDGPINVQLVTSVDGKKWSHTVPRTVVIPNGKDGVFDAGCILGVSSTAVHVGDETWLYYTGINTTHGGPMPPKRIRIGRAVWRRYGFASLDAADRGRIETKPLRLDTPLLIVNADASAGSLQVGLLEADGCAIPGLSPAENEPLHADATRHALRWTSGTAPPTNRVVRLVIEMNRAHLFSLSCL